MKRRDFLALAGGMLSLSAAPLNLRGLKAQNFNTERTINSTARERLLEIYSYVPNTMEYEALAVDDALWSDYSKQFDAYGYLDQREAFFDDLGISGSSWFTYGNAERSAHPIEPSAHVYIPVLAADQVLQVGVGHFPSRLTIFTGIDPAIPTGVFLEKGYISTPFRGGTVYIHAEQSPVNSITWNPFAVLLDTGVLVWFDSEESAMNYALWFETAGESLADSEVIARKLNLVEPDSITLAWVFGAHLSMEGSSRRVLGDYASDETVEAYKEQIIVSIERQEALFGEDAASSFNAGGL